MSLLRKSALFETNIPNAIHIQKYVLSVKSNLFLQRLHRLPLRLLMELKADLLQI